MRRPRRAHAREGAHAAHRAVFLRQRRGSALKPPAGDHRPTGRQARRKSAPSRQARRGTSREALQAQAGAAGTGRRCRHRARLSGRGGHCLRPSRLAHDWGLPGREGGQSAVPPEPSARMGGSGGRQADGRSVRVVGSRVKQTTARAGRPGAGRIGSQASKGGKRRALNKASLSLSLSLSTARQRISRCQETPPRLKAIDGGERRSRERPRRSALARPAPRSNDGSCSGAAAAQDHQGEGWPGSGVCRGLRGAWSPHGDPPRAAQETQRLLSEPGACGPPASPAPAAAARGGVSRCRL
jgi:hypothetical protein